MDEFQTQIKRTSLNIYVNGNIIYFEKEGEYFFFGDFTSFDSLEKIMKEEKCTRSLFTKLFLPFYDWLLYATFDEIRSDEIILKEIDQMIESYF